MPNPEMPEAVERKCSHVGCDNWFPVGDPERIYCGRRSCSAVRPRAAEQDAHVGCDCG
jgi:hypothetical protein